MPPTYPESRVTYDCGIVGTLFCWTTQATWDIVFLDSTIGKAYLMVIYSIALSIPKIT